MSGGPAWSLEVHQNRHLAPDEREMHALLTIAARGAGAAAPEAAEVILVDCSGSMDQPRTKIAAARRATAAAIDVLREGTFFAVVAGSHFARMIYPEPEARLARVTPETRAAAKAAVRTLAAEGGTAMSTWLTLARALLSERPAAIHHALLLTDGKNESESPEALERALQTCRGRFRCDARGIGDNWEPRQLKRIVEVLIGAADGVSEDAALAADFQAVMEAAMGRLVPDVRLRVTPVLNAKLRFLKQTHPVLQDLTGVQVGERTREFQLGAWADERREYHVCLDADPADARLGEDRSLARVDVVLGPGGEAACPPARVLVQWTDDLRLSIVLDSDLARATLQEEVNEAVVAGCDAYDGQDDERAAAEWGRAVRLATQVGNEVVLRRLQKVVEIVDASAGRVRIKPGLNPRDIKVTEMGSLQTISGSEASNQAPKSPGGPDLACSCGRISPPGARFCSSCGQPLSGKAPAP